MQQAVPDPLLEELRSGAIGYPMARLIYALDPTTTQQDQGLWVVPLHNPERFIGPSQPNRRTPVGFASYWKRPTGE